MHSGVDPECATVPRSGDVSMSIPSRHSMKRAYLTLFLNVSEARAAMTIAPSQNEVGRLRRALLSNTIVLIRFDTLAKFSLESIMSGDTCCVFSFRVLAFLPDGSRATGQGQVYTRLVGGRGRYSITDKNSAISRMISAGRLFKFVYPSA
jgi:hypothetical protein